MKVPPIRFVYFDLGKVIVDFDVDKMCRQMADVAGVLPDDIRRVLYQEGLQRQYELGLLTTEGFYEEFCRRLQTRPDPEKLLEAACDIFTLNVQVVPIVCRLALVRFPIGLLSNTCEAHWLYLHRRYRGVMELFPHRLRSYQCHAMKPDAQIFWRAAELAGCDPEEIFFVDDNPTNVNGAIAVGFRGMVYCGPRALAENLEGLGVPLVY